MPGVDEAVRGACWEAQSPAADIVTGTTMPAACGSRWLLRGWSSRLQHATVRVKLECEAQLRVFIESKVHEAVEAQDTLRRQLEEVNMHIYT